MTPWPSAALKPTKASVGAHVIGLIAVPVLGAIV